MVERLLSMCMVCLIELVVKCSIVLLMCFKVGYW